MAKRKTASETPFTKDMLPHTRRALWWDVVKLHYLELIVLGFALFVFALPMIFNMIATDHYTAQLQGSLPESVTAQEYQQVMESASVAKITSALVNIPLFAIFAMGLSGLLRIARQYAWGEVVIPAHDFALSIKQNIKQTVILAVIAAIVCALCVYIDSLATLNPESMMHAVSAAAVLLTVLFLLPIGAYMLVCIAVYNNTFGQNFLQGFVLYMKAPLKTLGGLVCFAGLSALMLIPNAIVHFAVTAVLILTAPFLLLGWFLFAYNRLDQFINSEKHPELVNRGLYIRGEEGVDDDESLRRSAENQ